MGVRFPRPRVRPWLATAVFAAAIMWATGGHAPPVRAAGDCTLTTEAALDVEEKAFLVLINNYRAQNGLTALGSSYYLARGAAWKSKHMGTLAYFAHDDTPIARTWVTRIRDCGYGYNTYLGENIAAGYTTAQSVFTGWQNSPGHNSNMLGANYTTIGIGRHYVAGSPYGWYWTTEFGGFDDGWATGGPEVLTPVGSIQPLDAPAGPPTTAASPVSLARRSPQRRTRAAAQLCRTGWTLGLRARRWRYESTLSQNCSAAGSSAVS